MSSPIARAITPELVSACINRRQLLRKSFAGMGVDGLLVNGEKDIRYLTGFLGHDSLLLVTPERTWIISDPRYDEYLDPWRELGGIEVVMGKRHRLAESVKQLCQTHRIQRVGVQAEHVTMAAHSRMAQVLGEPNLMSTVAAVSALRMRKDQYEITCIERAITLQQEALHAALRQLTIGMSEIEFSAVLEYEIKVRGSMGSGFSPIIGAAANSSIPHHVTGGTTIQPGVLLVDWGATVEGYNGDLTRTFAINEFPPKIREIYNIVLEAQLAAIAAIAPGKVCADIDAVARTIITKAGYGDYFGHGLGHGLGMDVHESPFFNDLETNTRLEPGMIMTVEPGIYLPGIGGVRIEDDVLITDSGCRVLSNHAKDLDSMTIDAAPAKSKVEMTKVQREQVSVRN